MAAPSLPTPPFAATTVLDETTRELAGMKLRRLLRERAGVERGIARERRPPRQEADIAAAVQNPEIETIDRSVADLICQLRATSGQVNDPAEGSRHGRLPWGPRKKRRT